MLQHVTLELRREDGERCAAFYELLGFERTQPPPSLADRALWLARAGTQVHLLWADDPVVPPRGHLAVVVEDFGAAFEALRDAGHPVEERTAHWGARRAVANDPAGHRVELMAAPPPAN